ncbi:hypothetical protein TNCV_2326931 [Trichonephila clavipes]|nr:hypothetical protein TNCV_2326931 [Trichonephila clavipes]
MRGSRNSDNVERRGWNELMMSNANDGRRNWRNSEALRRPSNGRNDYRGNYENDRQGNQWFDRRNRFQREMIEYLMIEGTNLEMGVKMTISVEGTTEIEVRVRILVEAIGDNGGAEGVRRSQGGDNESASFKITGFQKAFRVVYGCQFNGRRHGSKSGVETSGVCLSHA